MSQATSGGAAAANGGADMAAGNLSPDGNLATSATSEVASHAPEHFRIGKEIRDFQYWAVGPDVFECKRANKEAGAANLRLFLLKATSEPRDHGFLWIAGHAPEDTPPKQVLNAFEPVFASPDNIFEGMGSRYHRWTWWDATGNKWCECGHDGWMHFRTHDLSA